MITSEDIKRRLWNGANDLRGSMDASRYKDYMLGLLFYKFLSDKTLETFRQVSGMKEASEKEIIEEYTKAIDLNGNSVTNMLQKVLGYYVQPKYLYQQWISDIDNGCFEVQKVTDSLNDFERTIDGSNDSDDFKGLFSNSTLDLSDTALGADLKTRNNNIKQLIQLFADLNMADLQKGDILGDAYEYLIGMFAMESGKKAGEFYTPRQVSEVMAQIVAKSSKIESIYDAAVGSGSLLLTVSKHLDKEAQKNLNYYGQEKNTATYNLTRMNLLLHGVRPDRMTIRNADTLGQDWPEDPSRPSEGVQFDAVVMNPPYSLKKWNKEGIKASDPRFEFVGVLPPDSKGDYAFLLHGLYHLGQKGTMAIVLPHGVLFRGSAEGEIRKRLVDKNYLDAVIGLPSNLFTNTSIPVTVIILKKDRGLKDPVLIIDASNGFIKSGKTNQLQEKDIAKIVDAYVNKTEEFGYSHLASLQEISKNDYNLNIPRYVDSYNVDIPQDVNAHLFGGIPNENIKSLKILQEVVPDVLKDSFKEIRPGYSELLVTPEELSKNVLGSKQVIKVEDNIKKDVDNYIDKYWRVLRNPESKIVSSLKEEMCTFVNDVKHK
ncbi:MAG: type I restriction-modification system subunit M [Thomasclavelia sp.]|jgi:type I restriction enzyme M protein|nr:type I restriction-modification system subunit M [Thomasclavelia sp.]